MATKRHNTIVIAACFFISLAIIVNPFNRKPAKTSASLLAKTFRTQNGWGYEILVNDTVFIHQETIPCVPGHSGFRKEEQAAKTADLIINKLKRGQLPTVTIFEQEQICPLRENDKPGKSQ